MKALFCEAVGQPLRYAPDAPMPEAADGEVRIRLLAAALNHRDVWITKGLYPGLRFPNVLGSDGLGEWEGQQVLINPNHAWGQSEAAQGPDYHILGMPSAGTMAEYLCTRPDRLHPKPAHLSSEQAAALPLAGLTAYRALFTKGQAAAGQKVLISGVGGGVALFACQFAIAAGAEVYVTSGSEDKIARAVALGAQGGANYRSPDFEERLRGMAGGFDVIIDSAVGEGFGTLVKLCKPGARVVFYGGTRGKMPPLNPQWLFWRQISLHGSTMGSDAEFGAMLRFVGEKGIVPVVDRVFDLAEGQQALDYLASGQQFGKVVLRIG